MVNSITIDERQNNLFSLNWIEYYLYSIGVTFVGWWTLYLHGADFLTLYCVVAALLVAITPLIFRLPIKYRKRAIKLCSYGQLAVAGFCIVLLFASVATPAHAQFLNGLEAWLKQVMPASIHTALTLGINAIRAIFVYYAGTKLTEAYRESRGEGTSEFMTLAREPIRGGLIIAIADLIVVLFTG